jgi:hypothetical protein
MTIKHVFWGFVIALVSAIGWRYKDADAVQQWIHPQSSKPVEIRFDNDQPPGAGPAPLAGEARITPMPKAATGPHKCKKGNQDIYTDGDCPAGSKEQTIGGTVTVVPGQRVSTPLGATTGASRANVRDILLDPKDADLQGKRMDRIIGP